MKTVCAIGTGPSLSVAQIAVAREKGFHLYGCNLIYSIVPDLEVLYGVNYAFWEYYWHRGLRDHPCDKWTTNKAAADMFGLNHIGEKFMHGLSEDPEVLSHGHGSGHSLVNLAYLHGADRIVLLGYDCRYAKDYDGKARQVGSSPRHFFGEYPASMQHWPSVQVQKGVHIELLDLYQSIHSQGLVEVINCTPDSAIECFPRMAIEDLPV